MAPRLVTDRLLDLFVMEGRSPGRHVSTAIHRVMQRLHPSRFGDDPIDEARAVLGNALEKAIIRELANRYPDRYVIPGELTYRGIKGTPDLWDLQDWATVEVKLTWATAGRADDISDVWFWRYWAQLKTYAKMAGMTKGVLIICFVNGTWMGGKPGVPVGLAWEDDFSEEDLDENWRMVELYA